MEKHAADWVSEAPTPAQLKELFAQIASGRVTKNKLQALLNTKKEETNAFLITVNYDLSVESLVGQGKYCWTNDDITSKHFPTTRKGEATINLELVHLNQVLTSEEVLKELDKQGLRPAELHELLSFGAQYPEEQRKYPIVALGSLWQDWDGSRNVPYLGTGGIERSLGLGYFGGRWDGYYRFAAVSK